LKNPSTLSTVTEVAPRAVITPVEPEVPPVTVAPTSIVVMSDRAKVALVKVVEVLSEAPVPCIAETGIVAPLPCIAETGIVASPPPPVIVITSDAA